MKILRKIIILAVTVSCFCFGSCAIFGRDANAWFSEKELAEVHLKGLPAPAFMTEEIETKVSGGHNGELTTFLIFFTQPIENVELLTVYAEEVLAYLAENFEEGKYGAASYVGASENQESYYKISTSSNIEDYDDSSNVVKIYRLYYITADEYDDDGYYPDDEVYEIYLASRMDGEVAPTITMSVRYASGVSGIFQYK